MINKKIITAKNISKVIKDKYILKDVSFDISEGECVALIGPNGAGKTTLMNCLLGAKFITSGDIKVNDLKPTDRTLKNYVNVLSQENAVPERLKVNELLTFFCTYFNREAKNYFPRRTNGWYGYFYSYSFLGNS